MTVPYQFANVTGTILLSELDSNFDYVSNNVSTANTVLNPAQPNITSVGTLTSLSVTGNISGGHLVGNAVYLSSVPGANVIGTVPRAAQANTANIATIANSATTAGTVTTAAQPNITSVGTLSLVSVAGNVQGGNLRTAGLISATGSITGSSFVGAVASGTTVSATGNITGGNVLTSGLVSATGTVTGSSLLGSAVSVTGNINTVGNVHFGTSGNGLLYTDSVGFSVMVSGNTAAGSFISSGDQTITVGSHPTYGVTAITEYGTNFRAMAWNGGNLDLDRFGTGQGNIGNVNTVTASVVKTTAVVVSSLPAAGTAGAGARSFVSDADSTTFANLAVGGSTNKVPVYSDGTNWRIG